MPIKNLSGRTTVRYTKGNHTLRTHNEVVLISNQVVNEHHKSYNGIKGHSPMLLFDDIDIINSVPVDIMHCVMLGIVKNLIEIWIGKKRIPAPPYREYKIKSCESRKNLEKRICAMKPHSNFQRKPRSIFEVENFKATEFMHFMWYYLRYALIGILPTRIVKNFEKLSYKLCQKEIKKEEIKNATEMLMDFADEYEDIYRPGAVTMNLHLVRHFHSMIIHCGPVWCYDMFGFENYIGVLKGLVCGTSDVLLQVASKYGFNKDVQLNHALF